MRPALRLLPEPAYFAGSARFPLWPIDFIRRIEPKKIVKTRQFWLARDAVVSTYNEPLITAEWAVEVSRLAREGGRSADRLRLKRERYAGGAAVSSPVG